MIDTEPKLQESMLPRFSISRPVTVSMLLLAILVVGFISYKRIQMDLFPQGFSPPFLGIWVPYRDANPKEIEDQIVKPMEGELKTVKNLNRLFSFSSVQGVWFWLEFTQGANMDLSYSQVADRVERARPLLPEDQEYIYIRRFRNDQSPIIYMGISYDETVADPYFASEKFIKGPVEGVKGVANVELFGLREKYVQIIVDRDKIKTYSINLPALMGTLIQDNFSMSNGYVYLGKKKYLLRTKSRFSSLEDIRKIEIGNGVRLENIAKVTYDFDEELRSIMRVDGKVAAGLVAYKESAANTVEVCKNIVDKLNEQVKTRPELKGVNYFIFWNQGKMINESINNVKTTMMWGGFFAFLVLLFFLRKLKITSMLTLAIPLSLLLSVMCIYAMGWTLNAFTMMGLMISIGLVVDNSIVITENIYRFNGLGYDLRSSAIYGASEVGLAIVLATLTTIVVFLPLMIMGGNSAMSFYLTRIGVPVIFAIVGSLLIALILIPLGSIKAMPKRAEVIHATHSKITQWYQTAMVKILKHRLDAMLVILLVLFSMAIPLNLMKKTDFTDAGPTDARLILDFPPDYNVHKVDKVLNHITKKIMERKDVYHLDHISSRARKLRGQVEIYLETPKDTQWYQAIYRRVASLFGNGEYSRLNREELAEDLKKQLPEIPGVDIRTSFRRQGDQDSTLSFVVYGYDIDVLNQLVLELEKQLEHIEGVVSVERDMETGSDELHISADREKAFKIGTNPNYLAQLIRFLLGRRKISTYHTAEREIDIFVKSRLDQRTSVAQLKNTFIKTDSGAETTLAALADLTYHKSPGSIRRENGKVSLELKIHSGDEDMKDMTKRLEAVFKRFKFPTGYSYSQGARSRRFAQQGSDMANALLFSIVLIVVIMGVLFESFVLPFSVLVSIPAAFVGSFWLLFLTGTTMEIMANIGLVVLVGVVVNNAIVLIDMINQYRNSGMQREQAILVAGMHRFRPILMTALTTIFGLFPMAVGNTGLIGIPYAPMGITLIGGLVSSTFLTLFAVPVFYTYFDDLQVFWAKYRRRLL